MALWQLQESDGVQLWKRAHLAGLQRGLALQPGAQRPPPPWQFFADRHADFEETTTKIHSKFKSLVGMSIEACHDLQACSFPLD